METLQAIYLALAVFGVGVTVADLFGLIDRRGGRPARGGVGPVAVLRLAAWFSLGLGAVGLGAMALGRQALPSLLWGLGAGLVLACLSWILALRRAPQVLGFQAEDLILEEAEVTVPVAPGLSGKAVVRKAGVLHEVRVRAMSGAAAYARGARVRIIDYRDEDYLIEAADEEHLVR